MASCSETDLPIAWKVYTAKEADMRQVESLLNQTFKRDVNHETAAMDKGYDYQDVYIRCASFGVAPVISKRKNSNTADGPVKRRSDQFRSLYRRRASVEREFGRLKNHLGLTPLRTYKLQKVQLHADLRLLTRLALVATND